jgi:hypothetical protein
MVKSKREKKNCTHRFIWFSIVPMFMGERAFSLYSENKIGLQLMFLATSYILSLIHGKSPLYPYRTMGGETPAPPTYGSTRHKTIHLPRRDLRGPQGLHFALTLALRSLSL